MQKNNVDVLKKRAFSRIEAELPALLAIRDRLYREPEIGGTEKIASELLIQKLENAKFSVERNYFNVPYAFKAVYSSRKPGAAIGIFAEYNALPDVGHGCGHNLIAATSLGTALALCEAVEETGGAIIAYGTPGEENLQVKTPLTAAGAFDEADVAFMVHPSPVTYSSGKTLAIESLQIEFFGKALMREYHRRKEEMPLTQQYSAIMAFILKSSTARIPMSTALSMKAVKRPA